jgi:hypothetical protein
LFQLIEPINDSFGSRSQVHSPTLVMFDKLAFHTIFRGLQSSPRSPIGHVQFLCSGIQALTFFNGLEQCFTSMTEQNLSIFFKPYFCLILILTIPVKYERSLFITVFVEKLRLLVSLSLLGMTFKIYIPTNIYDVLCVPLVC